MKNTFGSSVSVTLFGESRGQGVGVVLDGICPGIAIDNERIETMLKMRSSRNEYPENAPAADHYEILSGVFHGYTTGAPLCIVVTHENPNEKKYNMELSLARPGHSDYTNHIKYHGFEDYRAGGHASGRVTAALVAAGAVAMQALEQKGIYVGTHLSRLAQWVDRPFQNSVEDCKKLSQLLFPALDEKAAAKMQEEIQHAHAAGDSIGGVLETTVVGLPAGLGEPWFDSVESVLAHALFGVPGVKGVEFGLGFGFANVRGSKANDPIRVDEEGRVYTKTNNNGGVNGGITNGMPLLFRCVLKPTSSIYSDQETIDLKTMSNANLQIKGRHDPAIVHRARAVVDSVTALTLWDLLNLRYGTDYLMPDQK